ncbi:MAG: hypothetical protein AB1599_06045 [Planctomycetota bacterium]
MLVIIRIQAQEKPEALWNDVLLNKDKLQAALNTKGRILYLSKRRNYNEVSLFVHVADANVLGDFITDHLVKLDGVTGAWMINMLKPVFYPLPENAGQMKRYTVTLKTYPPRLAEIYNTLAELSPQHHNGANLAHQGGMPSDEVSVGYLAYTCHLFGDCIQLSLQAPNDIKIHKYVDEVIGKIPGVLRTTICEIEKTHPFVSYDEWQNYISRNAVMVNWDEQYMVAQFQN